MAKPRTMVDIVGSEAGLHELLEQIGFLVRSLGRAEASQRLGALLVADLDEAPGGDVERFFPGSFAEVSERIGRINLVVGVLLDTRQAHQRLGQTVGVMDVVETKAAFDAKSVVVSRAIAAFSVDDLLVLDFVGDLAADAAIRAKRIDLAVRIGDAGLVLVKHHRWHQRAGRASLDAFAAGHAGRFPHRIVKVEHDLGAMIAVGHADDVVDLHLAAGAHAEAALDAGVKIDTHRRMAGVALAALGGREAAFGDLDLFRLVPELRIRVVGSLTRRLVSDQQLHHHFLRGDSPVACRFHLHADGRRPFARGRQHALALNLHHAGAAIAVRPVVRRGRIAQMRNLSALAFCDLPDGFADAGLDLLTVQLELDHLRSAALSAHRSNRFGMCNRYAAIRHVLAPCRAFGVMAVALRWRVLLVAHSTLIRNRSAPRYAYSAACCGRNSSGKYLMTDVSGFEAACPSPQIDASRIAWLNWPSSSWFQTGCCISIAAFWVPTGRGVHGPQLSSSKNFIRFGAASRTLWAWDRMMTAAEPIKQPYFSSVPKSSGMSSMAAGRIPPDAPPGK